MFKTLRNEIQRRANLVRSIDFESKMVRECIERMAWNAGDPEEWKKYSALMKEHAAKEAAAKKELFGFKH